MITSTPPARLPYSSTHAPRPLHPSPTRRSSDLVLRNHMPIVLRRLKGRFPKIKVHLREGAQPQFERWLQDRIAAGRLRRSEEHTSELQSLAYLVCRLLLEKKKSSHNCCTLS